MLAEQTDLAQFAWSLAALVLLSSLAAALVLHALYQLGLRSIVNRAIVGRWIDQNFGGRTNIAPLSGFFLFFYYERILAQLRLPFSALSLSYPQFCAQFANGLTSLVDGPIDPNRVEHLSRREWGNGKSFMHTLLDLADAPAFDNVAEDPRKSAALQLKLREAVERNVDRLQSKMAVGWASAPYFISFLAAAGIVLLLGSASISQNLNGLSLETAAVVVAFAALAAPPMQRMIERLVDGG